MTTTPSRAPARTPTLDLSPRKPARPPFRVLLYAVEGWGKTTAAAYAPKPYILMGRGETGYDTLLAAGQVPEAPGAVVETFDEALARLDALTTARGSIQTVVLDSASTFEDMLMDEVCTKHFDGDWGPQGFQSYGKGYGIASTEWMRLIGRLDRLHRSGCNVIIIGHAAISTFRNPSGADYKRYTIDLYDSEKASLLAPTKQFCDAVLFGNFDTLVELPKAEKKKGVADQRGKGLGVDERVVHTQYRDAWDAKNRHGLPAVIRVTDDPAQAWTHVWGLLSGSQA